MESIDRRTFALSVLGGSLAGLISGLGSGWFGYWLTQRSADKRSLRITVARSDEVSPFMGDVLVYTYGVTVRNDGDFTEEDIVFYFGLTASPLDEEIKIYDFVQGANPAFLVGRTNVKEEERSTGKGWNASIDRLAPGEHLIFQIKTDKFARIVAQVASDNDSDIAILNLPDTST